MDILVIDHQRVRQLETLPESVPETGFLWLDIIRGEDIDWPQQVRRLSGVTIHERHLRDSQNLEHPSFYDGTQDYEMLIFRGLSPADQTGDFQTRPAVFFVLEHLLLTIRPADSVSVSLIKPRLLDKTVRIPRRPAGLMHQLMTYMVDRYLALREPLLERYDEWRRDLLDPRHDFSDWLAVMDYTSDLRKLERLCDEQITALQAWREDTDTEFDDHLTVRFNDLVEHVQRIIKFAQDQKNEAEALVQLHFSAVAHRTNEIVRVLTVLSAIFLPLTFIAGLFGMNFENMPELKLEYAYFFTLGGMTILAIALLILFKFKKWL
ncbi:MAG: magnesium transporter CorA family protein [Thiohalophilus sp.]|uniref:magnesium transporter CorA family protein n=1 Tax=Thiohalophilus sp. TaxID=3028392 RepID=UPI00286FE32B|nr:magnesium transporter CorA family protein [Thiohalophilus sp.]MDR9437196.1 magnesium transporter CorA family protein [Thiohalophilus sp.]